MSFEKEIPSNVEVVNILGINDKNLKYIKSVFPEVKINVRGNTIYIDGKSKEAKEIIRIFDEDDLIRDMEIKMRSLPNQGIEITEGFCWSERMGVHFCPDGRTY